ncbi:unnamed protein product [Linum trigynum]|uniref:Uncharacterized protein n=1 Tax=Linum trigynum TaxID=586398 RepID=A0AAV2CUL0_9ROSI
MAEGDENRVFGRCRRREKKRCGGGAIVNGERAETRRTVCEMAEGDENRVVGHCRRREKKRCGGGAAAAASSFSRLW